MQSYSEVLLAFLNKRKNFEDIFQDFNNNLSQRLSNGTSQSLFDHFVLRSIAKLFSDVLLKHGDGHDMCSLT